MLKYTGLLGTPLEQIFQEQWPSAGHSFSSISSNRFGFVYNGTLSHLSKSIMFCVSFVFIQLHLFPIKILNHLTYLRSQLQEWLTPFFIIFRRGQKLFNNILCIFRKQFKVFLSMIDLVFSLNGASKCVVSGNLHNFTAK